ncbi:MAG: fimbria/pilus outer membrane usher protein, partial [Bdellovibrionales bacterium]|nr:fimbria/pilus outer membrane usher protein [Bdellovibrionales bacterium]
MNKLNSAVLFTLFFLTSALSWSQTNWQNEAHQVELPVYDGTTHLGDIKASVMGDKIQWLDKDSFLSTMRPHLKADTFKQLEKLPSQISPSTLPLPLSYNPSELRLNLTLEMSDRSSGEVNLMENFQHRYEAEALDPAPFAGAINYRLEQNWANQSLEADYFGGQFNSFLNMNTLVLESQTYYQSNQDQQWFRSDTRLIKDFERQQVRIQAGDIYPQIQGFMSPRPLGGVSVARNFSLNPYRLPYPTGAQNFTLNSRSMVKYFVNGSLIRSEYLMAGNYTAKDIPLNNGLNTIIIEATDDLGQKKIFIFRSSSSINLLNRGESRFDLSHGVPFLDQNFKREYRDADGKFTTGFFQYGFSSIFSASVYGQNQKDFSIFGSEVIQATPIGNFSAGYASSMEPENKGDAQSLSYQLIGQGSQWLMSQTLGLRYEHRSEEFKTTILDRSSVVQNNYAATYTLPLARLLTASIGGNYGDVRDNDLNDRYGFDSTLNLRFYENNNISLFVGRSRDENRNWSDVAYLFLTIAFPGSNDFVSTFYDQQQKATKVTYIKDNQNRLYHPKAVVQAENNPGFQSGEVDLQVPTPYGDFGGRINGAHMIAGDQALVRGNVRVNSAFVFAYDEGEMGAGISRPINNSFILFKPEERLKDQKISLRSTSPFPESESGIFKELTFNNLMAYQY